MLSGSDEFLEQLFHLLLDFGNRVVGRSKSSYRNALLVDNELGEVPFDGTAKMVFIRTLNSVNHIGLSYFTSVPGWAAFK